MVCKFEVKLDDLSLSATFKIYCILKRENDFIKFVCSFYVVDKWRYAFYFVWHLSVLLRNIFFKRYHNSYIISLDNFIKQRLYHCLASSQRKYIFVFGKLKTSRKLKTFLIKWNCVLHVSFPILKDINWHGSQENVSRLYTTVSIHFD